VTFRGRLLLALSWLACRLPEGPAFRFADFAGDLWYRFAPGRADQARRNLRRVCRSLAASGRGGPRVRSAADDPKALERLVRSSFRHAARYYLEVARNPSVTPRYVDERLTLDTPELIADAVVPGKAVLFVGLHFGSLELAVIFLAFRVGETVTPMETIDDPGLQAYFERTRGVAGIRLVGLREARRALTDALRNGIPVGLVGDRDLTGGGTEITLFGAPARLPMGPAMLAVESGVPTYGMTVRRAGAGQYRRARLGPEGVRADVVAQRRGDRLSRAVGLQAGEARQLDGVVGGIADGVDVAQPRKASEVVDFDQAVEPRRRDAVEARTAKQRHRDDAIGARGVEPTAAAGELDARRQERVGHDRAGLGSELLERPRLGGEQRAARRVVRVRVSSAAS